MSYFNIAYELSQHKEKPQMTKSMQSLTRRTALTGAAALAAGTAAIAIAKAVEPDPIYAAIEQHRLSEATYGAALSLRDRLEGGLDDEITRKPRVHVGFESEIEIDKQALSSDIRVMTIKSTRGTTKPIYVQTLNDIEKSVPYDADAEAWIADRVAALEADRRELEAKRTAAGLTAAEAASEAAGDKARDDLWALATTAPATLAGIAALYAYAREVGGFSNLFYDEEVGEVAEWHLERAICALAGMAEPKMSDVVAEMLADG
jgi:hypothetical protein